MSAAFASVCGAEQTRRRRRSNLVESPVAARYNHARRSNRVKPPKAMNRARIEGNWKQFSARACEGVASE